MRVGAIRGATLGGASASFVRWPAGAGRAVMEVVPVQTARSRDLGALALVLAILLVLLVTSIALGSPLR
jgi:hypothetical protein